MIYTPISVPKGLSLVNPYSLFIVQYLNHFTHSIVQAPPVSPAKSASIPHVTPPVYLSLPNIPIHPLSDILQHHHPTPTIIISILSQRLNLPTSKHPSALPHSSSNHLTSPLENTHNQNKTSPSLPPSSTPSQPPPHPSASSSAPTLYTSYTHTTRLRSR